VPAEPGEVIKGQLKCSTGVWRAQPDGSGLELLAWGIRNPYGMAFDEIGDLYVADNDFEEVGDRAIANDPDRVWRIRTARQPHGSVAAPEWFGFPDVCADGLPVWHETHLPTKGRPAQPLIQDPPPWAGPAAYLEKPHSCLTKMDFCRSEAFGPDCRGRLFLSEWGTAAPMNSPHPEDLDHGFKVVCVDVAAGTATDFVRNARPGPASAQGSAGIERPVDCKFHPDGRSLYVLDFGVAHIDEQKWLSYGHTGVLWRIRRR
jgi:glucose/arabinose dehydrogenase